MAAFAYHGIQTDVESDMADLGPTTHLPTPLYADLGVVCGNIIPKLSFEGVLGLLGSYGGKKRRPGNGLSLLLC